MKNWIAPALFILGLLAQATATAQISEDILNLKGRWYQDTRNNLQYSNWSEMDHQNLANQNYSILCGDTIFHSFSVLHFTDESASLSVQMEGKRTQQYSLVHHDNKKLVWENKDPDGLPKTLEWKFSSGGYATFVSDGIETEYRKETAKGVLVKVRAFLGANMNQYGNPASTNRFLARTNVVNAQAETDMLPGNELGLSLGFTSRSKPLGINFEVGLAFRQVGIRGSFYDTKIGALTNRDGHYKNTNLYVAALPEFFLGKKRNFSIVTGFYADINQFRKFKASANGVADNNVTSNFYSSPGHDLDLERGFLLGVNYRASNLKQFRPQFYLRYTHGINLSSIRAVSLGVATEFEIR